MMRTALALSVCLFVSGIETGAFAATPQQEKMKTCNADATSKALKGDERKAFMKTCLSADAAAEAEPLNSQQQKMKDCNAQAKGMKGDERKSFMSKCLKGSG